MSRDAVIVSTARTPLTKAGRGAFNNTTGATLGAFSIRAAVERAGLAGGEVDDVLMGTAAQQGSTGGNVARLAELCTFALQLYVGLSCHKQMGGTRS